MNILWQSFSASSSSSLFSVKLLRVAFARLHPKASPSPPVFLTRSKCLPTIFLRTVLSTLLPCPVLAGLRLKVAAATHPSLSGTGPLNSNSKNQKKAHPLISVDSAFKQSSSAFLKKRGCLSNSALWFESRWTKRFFKNLVLKRLQKWSCLVLQPKVRAKSRRTSHHGRWS